MRSSTRTLLVGAMVGALAGALLGAVASQAGATPSAQRPAATSRPSVISRPVVMDVVNSNQTSIPCLADGEDYQVRGRLVGPRKEVLGAAGSTRINVLVHGSGTGAWFWSPGPARYDYAQHLARAGETTLVIDRLGYGDSPVADGRATCLGAQAQVLHQVVQELRAGKYTFAGSEAIVPHAGQVVVHGHGLGAAIAEVEAAEFTDVDALVLMSWADTGSSQTAIQEAARMSRTCLSSDYAAYGDTAADFRGLLFHSAPTSLQQRAGRLRAGVPCGDVASLLGTLSATGIQTGSITAPVLVMFGADDALNRSGSAQAQADRFTSSRSVTARTFADTGSALPLEKAAPAVRRTALRWLDRTLVER